MEYNRDDFDAQETTDAPVAMTAAPAHTDEDPAVNGLVDGRGAADLLGFGEANPRRVSVWYAKRTALTNAGKPLTPLLSLLPEPVGVLNAGVVFTAASIIDFGIAAGFLEVSESEKAAAQSPARFDGMPGDDEEF